MYNMKKFTSQFGYSLVEVLVSISILMIAIIGPITIAVQGIKTSAFTLQQNTAYFLAQEGIESLLSLRNGHTLKELEGTYAVTDAWFFFRHYLDQAGGGPCDFASNNRCKFGVAIDKNSGVLNLTPNQCLNGTGDTNCLLYTKQANSPFVYSLDSTGSPSPYTRIITVYYYGNRMFIESEVFWTSSVFSGVEQQVKLYTTVFDLI
jgi:type II secretory pathway pseudopilin PulG